MHLILGLFLSSMALSSSVLFIGDSHSVGPFGQKLDEKLRSKFPFVHTVASCGSIPRWFYNNQKTSCGFLEIDHNRVRTSLNTVPTPLLIDLLSKTRPDVVIMEFGGNYLNYSNDEFIKEDIQRIIKSIKDFGASCFWVTQPDSRTNREKAPRVISLIKKAVGEDCPVFESQKVTRYPEIGGDGTHYWNTLGTPIAYEWAGRVFNEFMNFWHEEDGE